MEIFLSEIDRLRFGHVTGKAKIGSGDSIEDLIKAARNISCKLLIVRFPTKHIEFAQALEHHGALLTDTLVYYSKNEIERYSIDLPNNFSIKFAQALDSDFIENVALDAFKGYSGHYHADPHLKKSDCDAVYSSWAKNSCINKELADEVILIKRDNEIAAFATLKSIDELIYEGILFGVSKKYQKRGLHFKLMQAVQNWGLDNCKNTFLTSTQITNIFVQKNWCRVGMELLSSFYTYHLWIK